MPTILDFKIHPEFPAYRFWTDGSFQSRWKKKKGSSAWQLCDWGRFKHGGSDKDGYKHTTLCYEGVQKGVKIHQVLCLLFLGPKPENSLVLHRDDNPANNWLDNLSYGTLKDNYESAVKNGKISPGGDMHPNTRITKEQVSELRRLRALGYSYPKLGEKIGISSSQAWNILNLNKRGFEPEEGCQNASVE